MMDLLTLEILFKRFINDEKSGSKAQRLELFLDTIEILDLETLNGLAVTLTAQRKDEFYKHTDNLCEWRIKQSDNIHNNYYSQMKMDKKSLKDMGYKNIRFWLEFHDLKISSKAINYIGTLNV